MDSVLLSALEARIKWTGKRQSLIAENIANVDTPGFKAKDLRPLDFNSVLKATQSTGSLSVTNAKHLKPSNATGDFLKFNSSKGSTLSKNGVDIEEETLKMAETKDLHAEAIGIYKKYTDMLKLTIGRAGAP